MPSRTTALPIIDVTSLGSYVFCQRAGVISYKQQGLERGNEEEPRIPNLSYLPEFSVAELEARFKLVFPPFLRYGLVSLIGFLLVWFVAAFISASLALLLLLAGSIIVWKAISDGLLLLAILAELSRYKEATPTPLDLTATEPIEVSWYSLVKAGYIPTKPQRYIEDESLNLRGQPWRILQSTDADRIPVFNYSGRNFVVRDSQKMRLTLYSHLCKVSRRGGKSDWGIILDVATRRCFAIPIDDNVRAEAIQELKKFSNLLDQDHQGIPVKIPAGSPCQNCRYGKPRPFVNGSSETVLVTGKIGANTQTGHNGQLVHCDCGDEFEWRPHHHYWEPKVANPLRSFAGPK